jgi:dTDP-4-amino-4,6-dideoxygalactose transaminase
MNIPFVDLYAQYLSIKPDIDTAIENVIKETAFIGGKYVKQFEENFAKEYGIKHCIACANGTDAIYILLKMLGIGKGDEVITVANSWISTSETIGQTGAIPVFIDIEADYSTIDFTKIEEKINSKTKAIIPVHLYGQSADIKKIKEICDNHNLFLIEDCAQAHFAEFENQLVGTFGEAATFSFYPGKNLGAYGDAGCIITNNDELAEKCRMYANHGALKKHFHQIEGINSRLDGMQAAILNAKLPFIKNWNAKRLENALYYNELLSDCKQIITPKIRQTGKHIFHVYSIRTSKRDELQFFLNEKGIQTAIHYPVALPLMPAYKHLAYSENDIPNAAKFQHEILSLPMYPELTKQQIEYIVHTIKLFFNGI